MGNKKNDKRGVGFRMSKEQKNTDDSQKTSYTFEIIGAGTLLALALSPFIKPLLEHL
jgi:hypothetical protein